MASFKDLRIIFFGTPDFAVASLKALVEAGANIAAVVTAPDKPAGRGMQLQASAVKQYATEHNLQVLQPEKLKNPEFVQELKNINADLHIVVAFRMLPEVVWNMPPLGTVNVHASLLPQYRGAAPINWAIINGETETGVTTFRLKHEIDTGNILMQQKVAILPEDNIGTLYQKLMEEGGKLLVATVKGLAEGTLQGIPQDAVAEAALKHAPKIFKEDTLINWLLPAEGIHNLIRGLSPSPGAYTMFQGKVLKIYKSHFVIGGPFDIDDTGYHVDDPIYKIPAGQYIISKGSRLYTDSSGEAEKTNTHTLKFACADGWLFVDELQLEGKKRMNVEDFLRGFKAQ